MRRAFFLILFSLLFLVAACSNVQNVENMNVTANSTGSMNESGSEVLGATNGSAQMPVKEFDVVAKQWTFDPAEIRVQEGDKVVLNIESVDVAHSFVLPDFGVDETLNPGDLVRIEFVADKKGSFSFSCGIYCGEGHNEMNGLLIVE